MQYDQYTRYKAYRARTAPRSGQFGAPNPPGAVGAVGLGAFAEDTTLADSVAALIAQINAWSADEANRVRAYTGQLATLSQALAQFLAIPAINEAFGAAITMIVGQLAAERDRAAAYLSTLG